LNESFSVGEVHFRVTYPGPLTRYPLIESFVFVGKNLSDENIEDSWYFQFADLYAQYVSILETSGGDRRCRER